MTSSLLNYLPHLMVIAHKRSQMCVHAHVHTLSFGVCESLFMGPEVPTVDIKPSI